MNIILIAIIVYILALLSLLLVHNKIIKDNKKIIHTINQDIDNIIYKISIYIHDNSNKISDILTLQEVIFASQKQYLNSNLDIYSKETFYHKLTDNLEYINNLTGDNLADLDSQKNINKGFGILHNNHKITQALKVLLSIGSLGVLYLFCDKL